MDFPRLTVPLLGGGRLSSFLGDLQEDGDVADHDDDERSLKHHKADEAEIDLSLIVRPQSPDSFTKLHVGSVT